MAKPKPAKKLASTRALPMELRIGDRLVDETGEWEIIGRPYTTAAGKNARLRVPRVGEPAVTDLRTWGARARRGEAGMMLVLAALALVLFATAGCSSGSICLEQDKGVSASEECKSGQSTVDAEISRARGDSDK